MSISDWDPGREGNREAHTRHTHTHTHTHNMEEVILLIRGGLGWNVWAPEAFYSLIRRQCPASRFRAWEGSRSSAQ